MNSRYLCPFCGFGSNELALIGSASPRLYGQVVIGSGSRYGKCPKCRASDREKLIYLYLYYELKVFLQRDIRILHIAPENLLGQELLDASFTEYIAADLLDKNYSYPAHVIFMDLLDISFPEGYFDLVICNHVLEHIQMDLLAISNIYRVLKTGGRAILQVPISKNNEFTIEDSSIIDPIDREYHYGQADHVRLYGQDYPNRLAKVGFKVERQNIFKKYPRAGINPLEDIFVGIKR